MSLEFYQSFSFGESVSCVGGKQFRIAHLSKLELLSKLFVAASGLFVDLSTMMKRLDIDILVKLIRL